MKKFIFIFVLCLTFTLQVSAANHCTKISYDKSGFDKIYKFIDDAVFDLRYYSPYNFTGSNIRGYKAPVAYMTKEALQALVKAAEDLRKQGYRLLIWDAYRPKKAVEHFVKWINDINDEGDKSFYPDLNKEDLLGHYLSKNSSHMRGSTIDLTIVNMDGSSVDMGGTFDLFSEISHSNYQKLTKEQKQNRKILHDAMIKAGFKGISSEWWHFALKNEPYKNICFNFDVE